MKLQESNSIFNMGDTSNRVKQVVEVNKVILSQIKKFNEEGGMWQDGKEIHEEFYKKFLEQISTIEKNKGTELFENFKGDIKYTKPKKSKIGFRGRTLTNTLVKSGLINKNRKLSLVGLNYLNDNLQPADNIESLLNLSSDNLVYFRQYLKLRVYSNATDN